MNNKGKGNALFIVLIPLFIFLTLVISDTVFRFCEEKRFKSDTEEIINEVMDNEEIDYKDYYKEIKKLYERKKYKTDMLVVEADQYNVHVENEGVFFGLFTSLSKTGEEFEVKIFNIDYLTFKLKKNSRFMLKVDVKNDLNGKRVFEYSE